MNRFWVSFGYISSAFLVGMGIYNLIFNKELLPQIFLGIIVFMMVNRYKNIFKFCQTKDGV